MDISVPWLWWHHGCMHMSKLIKSCTLKVYSLGISVIPQRSYNWKKIFQKKIEKGVKGVNLFLPSFPSLTISLSTCFLSSFLEIFYPWSFGLLLNFIITNHSYIRKPLMCKFICKVTFKPFWVHELVFKLNSDKWT